MIDDDALDLLRQQVAADIEKNKLAQETLEELRRTRQAESQRTATWLQIAESVAAMPNTMRELLLAILGLSESNEAIARRLDRIDNFMLIIASGRNNNGNKARLEELKSDLEKEHYQTLLFSYHRNLQHLQEQAALYGDSDIPLRIMNEIEQIRANISKTEEKLNCG